jgi:parvulin-like peptidyl-prolyl isomerase
LISVALAGTLVATGCGSASAAAATVNGRKIDRSDFEKELKALAENKELRIASGGGEGLLGKGKSTVDARLSAGWLTAVIYDALITEAFEDRNLKITEEDKAEAATQLAEQFSTPKVANAFPKWFRDRLSSRNARAVALRTSLTGLSQSEADLRKYYDEHKSDFVQVCLSHILVKSSKEDAEAALARIKGGEDFAAVARAVSEDPGSKDKGGDLGCNFAGLFVKEFADAAVVAPIGQPTDPVQTQFGFHILLVKDRPQAPFEAVRTQVKTNLNNESQAKFREFLGKAAQKAKVTVDPRYGTFKSEPPGAPEVVPPPAPAPAEGRPETTSTTRAGGLPLDQLPGDTTPSTTAP